MKRSSTSQQIINCEKRIKELQVRLKTETRQGEVSKLMEEISQWRGKIKELQEKLKK